MNDKRPAGEKSSRRRRDLNPFLNPLYQRKSAFYSFF